MKHWTAVSSRGGVGGGEYSCKTMVNVLDASIPVDDDEAPQQKCLLPTRGCSQRCDVPFLVKCPNCPNTFKARDDLAGKIVRCPHCKAKVEIQVEEEAEEMTQESLVPNNYIPASQAGMVHIAPRSEASIWAWFVGLPVGLLILTIIAMIIIPVVLFGCCFIACLGAASSGDRDQQRQQRYENNKRF
jgi:DNA-directed RNA polymerase subunit RPC12/RpoP